MGIKLVTFYASTVTPQDDALIYETALSGSGMIYGGTVTIKSANVLHVASGHGALCGRKFTIEETDVPVVLASTGTLLGRIYIHMDLSDTDEPISLEVETGSSLAPVIQQQDVNINDGVYEINLATFDVDTATISNLENVAPFIDSTPDAEFSPSSQNAIQNKVITKALGNPEIIGGAASRPYVKGELLLASDGQLYEVTADISYQGLITVGGNVRSTGNIITQISNCANSIDTINTQINYSIKSLTLSRSTLPAGSQVTIGTLPSGGVYLVSVNLRLQSGTFGSGVIVSPCEGIIQNNHDYGQHFCIANGGSNINVHNYASSQLTLHSGSSIKYIKLK